MLYLLSLPIMMQVDGEEQLFSVDVEQSVRGNRAIRGRAEKLVGLLHGGVDWEKRAEALQVEIPVMLVIGTHVHDFPPPMAQLLLSGRGA